MSPGAHHVDVNGGESHAGDFVLDMAASPTTDQLDGVTAGVYGGWWSEGGLTLDGTVNGNFLKLDHDRPVVLSV